MGGSDLWSNKLLLGYGGGPDAALEQDVCMHIINNNKVFLKCCISSTLIIITIIINMIGILMLTNITVIHDQILTAYYE